MLFDSHAHINEASYSPEERAELIKTIEASDVDYVADIGYDLASSKLAVEHAAKYPWVYAVVGCHPHDADSMDEMELVMYKGLARKKKVVAIGEIGLDFHYDHSPRDTQREWFRRQIRLANELKMPIVIHSREADQETMDILKEEGAFSGERKSWFPKRPDPSGYTLKKSEAAKIAAAKTSSADTGTEKTDPENAAAGDTSDHMADDARVLIHCFSGSAELAAQYVKLGATISIAGPVTYKNNRKGVAVSTEIPIDFLLVETDAPYLSPEPLRGRRNMSPNVVYTAKKIAGIKGMTLGEVAAKTKENAMRFYGICD